MPLETGDYITDLVPTNPLGTDPKSEGDDHLRLVKKTVQQSFPFIDAQVDASSRELNDMLAAFLFPPAVAEKVVQHLAFSDGDLAGGVGQVIPSDNTIPQISEGLEYLPFSQSITPLKIGNRIRVRVKLNIGSNGDNIIALALFVDGANNAVQVDSAPGSSSGFMRTIIMTYDFPALALDPIEIMTRFGPSSATQCWVNAGGGGVQWYMNMVSEMTITEVEPLP